ncbi:MAG: (lysyl endopeptidase) subfamily protein [Capsulimonas sp.]|nr:(lysyl endopeptidase) subfamily protein [Capsulimonas sp.]
MTLIQIARRIAALAASAAALLLTLSAPRPAQAAYTAIYGADGCDYYQFTGSSAVAGLKTSGWNGLIMFAVSVQSNGDITYSGNTLVTGGTYVGSSSWSPNVNAVKTPPTTVYRYEVCIGGWGDASFTNIKNLIASQGTGSGSILYRNFQALKNAVPGIDAINFDDEQTYDVASATSFGQLLNGRGFKVSLAPYTNQNYWVQLKHNLGSGCDLVYLQCYQGGAGNDPGNWNAAFGGGFHVMPGIESNNHSSSPFFNWAVGNGATGGFYWPDLAWGPGSNWGATEILSGIGIPNSGGHMVQLANINSGLLLNAATVADGVPNTGDHINQWTSVNKNQIWTLSCTGQNSNFWNSLWSLTYYTGSSQTLSTVSQSHGGAYQLYPWYNGGSQKFTFTPSSSFPGCYKVTFMDGWVMDDQNGGTGIGTPIQEWDSNNSNAQLWQLRFNPQTGY